MAVMTRIIKVGNSLGIVIPQHLLREVGLKVGDKVYLDYLKETQVIVISKTKKGLVDTRRFYKTVEMVEKKYSAWVEKHSKG